ncbi:hypothetical protein [Terrimicrobium sacchariphilum]|nr:hypothetical protein [Terrimicrobium sacchariphilum]
MKLPLLSPWWLCLLALPLAAFLILGTSQEDSRPALSPKSGISAPKPAISALPMPRIESEVAPSVSPTQQQVNKSPEAETKPEDSSSASLSMEIGPDQAVPAAVASFAKDFTPQDISVAQQLRQAFFDAVANLSPKDPDFTAKWNAAQKENDELYRLYYGKDRYLAQHRKAYTESFANGNQQPEH